MQVFLDMVATGQEMVKEKKILQGQGNVGEFYSGSGKIGILKKSQGKLKLQVWFNTIEGWVKHFGSSGCKELL